MRFVLKAAVAALLLAPGAALGQADIASAGANGLGVNGAFSTTPGSLGERGGAPPATGTPVGTTAGAQAPGIAASAPAVTAPPGPSMSAARPDPYSGSGAYGPGPVGSMPALESAPAR